MFPFLLTYNPSLPRPRPSRQAAREYLGSRPVFKRWDPRAVDAYIDHALGPANDGDEEAVTLKCRPETEAGFYMGAGPSVWPQLHLLGRRPHAPVVFMAGAESEHMGVIIREQGGSASGVARALVGMMGANTSLNLVPGGSHFLPMERPALVAAVVLERLKAALAAADSLRPRSPL